MHRLLPVLLLAFCVACNTAGQTGSFPDFKFLDTDSVTITVKDIQPGKGLMLVYFRSDCDHCRHMAQVMKGLGNSYPVPVWMVSAEDMDMIRLFEEMTGLYDIDNLRTMRDYTFNMHTWFDFKSLPFIVLFDKNGRQVKQFEDLPQAATIDSLLRDTNK